MPSATPRSVADRGLDAAAILGALPDPVIVIDRGERIRFVNTAAEQVFRLREAGMIKSTPNKIIADATDWRFLNELKRELKG